MYLILKEQEKYKDMTRNVMTEKGYKNYCEELEREKISNIWDDEDVSMQEKYNQWSKKVEEIKKKHEEERKPKKIHRSKTMRNLLAKKKELKEEKVSEQVKENKDRIHKEIELLKEQIMQEEKEQKFRKIMKTTEKICKDGKFDSGGFWKLQKRMKKQKEKPHAVVNIEGEK